METVTKASRRHFLGAGGYLVLVLPGVWTAFSLQGCGEGDECSDAGTAKASGDHFIFTSSCNSGHVHTFSLAITELSTPPAAGISRATSAYEGGHRHTVELSEAELMQIDGGDTVTKTSSASAGHTHEFTFTK